MKIDFNIWWHRIIIVFIIALIFSVGMFIVKEKPFSEKESGGVPAEEDHGHEPEAEEHGH